MRRILIATFALAATATWAAFANEFVPVSAPTFTGEAVEVELAASTNHRNLTPAEMAHLSDLRIVAREVKRVQALSPVGTPMGSTATDSQPVAAALYETPGKNISSQHLLPQPPDPYDSFARLDRRANDNAVLIAASHSKTDDSIENMSEEANPRLPRFIAALKELPTRVITGMRLAPIPKAPAVQSIAIVDANKAQPVIAIEPLRAQSTSTIATFVSAIYQVPSAAFEKLVSFVRPAEPEPPSSHGASTASQNSRPAGFYDFDPGQAENANPKMPTYITTMSEAPTAAFSPQALLTLPKQPQIRVTTKSEIGHSFASIGVASIDRPDRSDKGSAIEASPVLMPVNAVYDEPNAFITPRALESIEPFQAKPSQANIASIPTTETPRTQEPVPIMISGKTEVAASMLHPMVRPTEAAPLFTEDSSPALNASGESGASTDQFTRTVAQVGEPAKDRSPQPVLITGNTLFSATMLQPLSGATTTARPFFNYGDPQSVIAAVRQDGSYCDPNYVGPPIRFSQTVELTLEDLIRQLHQRFGVNFILGKGVGTLPMNIKAGSIPWNILLRSQLFVSGVRARCISTDTIELVENKELPSLQDSADVTTRFIKLRFLQPTVGGNVNISGQSSGRGANSQSNQCSQGGGGGGFSGGGGGGGLGGGGQACGNFEKLIIEIEKILGIRSRTQSSIGGGGGGQGTQQQQTEEIRRNRSVSIIPGRNMLVIQASDDEMKLIQQIIDRADRPPFQVIIKGLIYTANETKLKDIGVEPSIFANSADGRTHGSILGDSLGAAGTLFDFSTIIGTVDFGLQATALEENGVISIKSRPFATVLDGETADLTVGRQVPVLIQAQNNLGGAPGTLQILQAANLLSVTPQVVDDDNGLPIAVNLTLQLESNEVDTSVTSQGVPAVSVRSIQSRIILNQEQTAILGGFTVDSDSRTVRKTPFLGDIPIIGELFKRRLKSGQLNRLYFALAVEVVPFPGLPEPVRVPGATTDPPSVTPSMKTRSDKAEPKQVVAPKTTGP